MIASSSLRSDLRIGLIDENNGLRVKTMRFFLFIAKAMGIKKAEVFDFQCVVRNHLV